MKSNRTAKIVAALGVVGCAIMGVMPIGCRSSIESAPIRYRAEYDGSRLPDITVERLQGCFEDHGEEFEDSSIRVEAKVQLYPDGHKRDMQLKGLPFGAPNFAACTQNALRDMTVPALPLRSEETASATDEPAKPRGNEVANPAVFVEIVVLLGEFVAQHGGRAALYAVTIEVLAVAGITQVRKKQKWEKDCQTHLTDCLLSPLGSSWGDVYGTSRCLMCYRKCGRGGWPTGIVIDDDVVATCRYE